MGWQELPEYEDGTVIGNADINAIIDNLKYLHNRPKAAVFRNTNFEVSSGGEGSIIEWSQAVWDTNGMWDSVEPTELIIPENGIYTVMLNFQWVNFGDDTGAAGGFIQRNGNILGGDRKTITEASTADSSIARQSNFAENDVVEALFWQNTSTAQEVYSEAYRTPIMTIIWEGPAI